MSESLPIECRADMEGIVFILAVVTVGIALLVLPAIVHDKKAGL